MVCLTFNATLGFLRNRCQLLEDCKSRPKIKRLEFKCLLLLSYYRETNDFGILAVAEPCCELISVFIEDLRIADGSHVRLLDGPCGMSELASQSVGTVEILMVLLAEFSFVSRGHMLLLL
jgi:hypothetical protein